MECRCKSSSGFVAQEAVSPCPTCNLFDLRYCQRSFVDAIPLSDCFKDDSFYLPVINMR